MLLFYPFSYQRLVLMFSVSLDVVLRRKKEEIMQAQGVLLKTVENSEKGNFLIENECGCTSFSLEAIWTRLSRNNTRRAAFLVECAHCF